VAQLATDEGKAHARKGLAYSLHLGCAPLHFAAQARKRILGSLQMLARALMCMTLGKHGSLGLGRARLRVLESFLLCVFAGSTPRAFRLQLRNGLGRLGEVRGREFVFSC
jgi:hypothetical protein